MSGLISYQNIQQRRPRKEHADGDDSFHHDLAYHYKLRVDGSSGHEEISICARAFVSLHGIARGRLRTLQSKVVSGTTPKDGRGTHDTRPHKVPLELTDLIKLHIKSFKARQSH